MAESRGLGDVYKRQKYKELTAVDNLDLDVKKGEILGLLGPNGSGKSTTINCMLSLLKKDSGSVKIFGKEMSADAYDIKKRIGVVFQDVAVYDELTVYENIDYFCGLYIQDKSERKELVKRALDLVSLNDFVKFKPKKLSGGLLRLSLIHISEPTRLRQLSRMPSSA